MALQLEMVLRLSGVLPAIEFVAGKGAACKSGVSSSHPFVKEGSMISADRVGSSWDALSARHPSHPFLTVHNKLQRHSQRFPPAIFLWFLKSGSIGYCVDWFFVSFVCCPSVPLRSRCARCVLRAHPRNRVSRKGVVGGNSAT